MFPLFRKNILFLPFCRSSSSLKSNLHKLFIKFQACKFSSSSSSSSPSQAHSRSVKVSVWWDVDNCGVPSGVSYKKVASSIMAAVRANGIKGDINIKAYSADGFSNFHNEEGYALELTGIDLKRINEHNYTDGKTAAYEELLRDLQDWVYKNPPPAHLFLIFGDVHFSGILHRLRMCNYNILLACPGRAHVALYHAATIVWQWSSLLKGEDLTGRHFNYPPDGLFNSGYGNSNVPLENPFSTIEQQPTSSQNVEIYKPSLDLKLGEASKSVSRQVMKMLSSHPHGISIGDLRAKLTKCDRPLVKRFYGYQKFSEFLVSIPRVQLQYLGEDNFWVCLLPSTTSVVKNKQKACTTTQKLHNEGKNIDVGKPNDVTAYEFCSRWAKPKSLEEWQQHASDWENMRVSVWWDFNSCGVPSDISFLNVAPSIMGVLRANRIKGPIHIDAYGDVSQLSEIEQEALYLSGIDLRHIPGGKNISHKRLMDWASQNPPPAHLFLIYDDRDRDFVSTMRLLCERGYNILLAIPKRRESSLATIVWQWSSMLKGKYFTGKYYDPPPHWYIKGRVPLEYPPEWYRNSNVPLNNPFSAVEEPASSQNAEIHEPSSYINLVEVQNSLSKKVRKILSLYPNGISIGDLWLQLTFIYMSLGMFLDKPCKPKEFPNILVAIPHVQLLYIGEGDFCVRLIPSTVVKNEQRGVNRSRMPVVFSTGSFWDDVESFVFTSRGSRLLSRSRSREDVAHKLQKHGPLFLMSLTRNDILQLVELLIVEKKWLEESPQAFPFRLTHPLQKSSLMGQSHGAKGF